MFSTQVFTLDEIRMTSSKAFSLFNLYHASRKVPYHHASIEVVGLKMEIQIIRWTLQNMEIDLFFYKKCANIKSTYDLTFHLMVTLATVISLASMMDIANLDTYESHSSDEKVFDDFIDES